MEIRQKGQKFLIGSTATLKPHLRCQRVVSDQSNPRTFREQGQGDHVSSAGLQGGRLEPIVFGDILSVVRDILDVLIHPALDQEIPDRDEIPDLIETLLENIRDGILPHPCRVVVQDQIEEHVAGKVPLLVQIPPGII